jgi:hypothetical protein
MVTMKHLSSLTPSRDSANEESDDDAAIKFIEFTHILPRSAERKRTTVTR